MKLVKIVNGTYGFKQGSRVIPKTAADAPFALEDTAAERLVRLKVAEYADETIEVEAETDGSDRRPYDADMKIGVLKAIAIEDYGLDPEDIDKMRSRKDVVAAIDAKLAEEDGAGESDEGGQRPQDDTPPDIGAAEPVG